MMIDNRGLLLTASILVAAFALLGFVLWAFRLISVWSVLGLVLIGPIVVVAVLFVLFVAAWMASGSH